MLRFFFLDFREGHPNIIPPTESHGYDSLVLHFLTNNYKLLLTKVTAVISIYKKKGKIKNERKIEGGSQNSTLNVQEHGPTISVN